MINIELICKPRGCGKTYDLIMESARTGIPILTAYDSRYIADQARWMGVKIHQPMSVQEYKYFKNNGSLLNSKDWKGKLLIDEVDGVLEQLLGTHVVTATCTPDSMNKKENNDMLKDSLYCSSNNGFTYTESSINLPNGMKVVIENGGEPRLFFPKVEDVRVIVPNKVVEVIFADGTKEKSVCREPDVFSLESAISICISKKIMGGTGAYNNAVKRGLKVYDDKLKKAVADKAEKERIAKKRAKRHAYKERRAAEREQAEKERQIEIQKEAYIQAMEYMKRKENK